jgi:hypothetical protein
MSHRTSSELNAMQHAQPIRLASTLAPAVLALLASCSGGGGGGEVFGVESINVPAGGTWQINRPIRIAFTAPVDFKTVSLNTINVRQVGGGPSAGEFYLESPNVVVFQPRCPTLADLSDAGLQPGGIDYELNVLGIDKKAPLTVKSASGTGLSQGDVRKFTTPDSTVALDLFFDSKVGPPIPIVRTNSPADQTVDACYIELGGDPANKVYFRIDSNGVGNLDPLQSLPLNRLSELDEQVALMLHFNQAVDPSATNIDVSRLSWQFDAAAGGGPAQWTNLSTEIELVANCTQFGALIRIEPLGILPPDTDLRVVVAPEFSDIVGQVNLLSQSNFARASTDPAPVAPAPLPDQFLDGFASSAALDSEAGFAEPPAVVQDGKLAASFSFTGTGGTNGEFDWRIPAGQTLIFSTDSQIIVGGPNFIPQYSVTVVGGVVDVRNMRIEAGGTLKVQGTKPLTILASGFVEILGTLDIRGTDSKGVVTLNTTNIPEPGAPGNAGGGRGGTGSPLTTASSPKGGNGFGAFNAADGGGVGGETGWTNFNQQVDSRRGAGGGGGTFGANQPQTGAASLGTWDQSFIGLDAEAGFTNLDVNCNGASSGLPGPFGGAAGPSPFSDSKTNNNFWGQAVVGSTLIQGELNKTWAGAGGGAGGDAAFVPGGGSFPAIPFEPTGNEKGGAGGGGGGSLQIMALGNIVFGVNGKILCRGGSGGGGENTSFVNRVGGAGGGGSGGHVILQTAGVIDMTLSAGGSNSGATIGTMLGGILASGGQGGAGKSDLGGATLEGTGKQDTFPQNDACPPALNGNAYPTSGTNACKGHVDGAGGDGGPGMVQLHTPNGLTSVLLPVGKTISDVIKPRPQFFDGSGKLVPTFGQLSRAQSVWIPLGEGGFEKSAGTFKSVTFTLEGIDPLTGLVLDDGSGGVQLVPSILPGAALVSAPGVPSLSEARTIVLSAAGIDPEYAFVLDNPTQLQNFLVRLEEGTSGGNFDVVSASYDAANQRLTLVTDPEGPSMSASFGLGAQATLHPAFFRVYSDGTPDLLPVSSTVTILVQATEADPVTGLPDPAAVTGFVTDVADLNTDPNNSQFRFVRYQVLFDIDATGGGLSADAPIPSIDFLRLPFRYE